MRPVPRCGRCTVMAALLIAAATLWPDMSAADGALAVGLPKDVAAEGFAYGFAVNKANAAEANNKALADCKTPAQGVDQRAQALCAVMQSFHNQCFAVAMDPKDATPGVGWAVEDSKEGAGRSALDKCKATAGDDRRDFCTVTHTECDGTAK